MEYRTKINWKRNTEEFNAKSFDRTHHVTFGKGYSIEVSSAPEFLGRAELPNPEELFIASISSCFMLTLLYWAAVEGIIIDDYTADAKGSLAKNSEGKMAVTEVTLSPKIIFHDNKQPDSAKLDKLLKKAHEQCFISSSIKTKVVVNAENVISA